MGVQFLLPIGTKKHSQQIDLIPVGLSKPFKRPLRERPRLLRNFPLSLDQARHDERDHVIKK
jgi:hypothetical protein